ncbi:MAG: lamin tail domain-containing protein, partial [Planctomycetota bacterium]
MKGASFLTGVVTLCFCLTAQAQDGLIISELVDGTLPGGQPKWVELTNCGDTTLDMSGFSIGNYNNGGTNLGGGQSTVLAGTLDPGASYIVAYENEPDPSPSMFMDLHGFLGPFINDDDVFDFFLDEPEPETALGVTSVFFDTYGFAPDFFVGPFTNGDDVLALFLADGTGPNGEATGDGSDATLVDVYGVIGVDGTGEVWEYTDGYSYRYGGASATPTFDVNEWFFGGANSLEDPGGDDAVELELILANTHPGTHSCGAMLINEIHADPAADLPGDANGDGVRDSSDDEFVEIYNNTGGDLDISGWELADGFGFRHEFPGGTMIAPACAVVVFGGGSPTGAFGGAVVQTASTGSLGLNN